MTTPLDNLRTVIQESLRVQRGASHDVKYIDTGSALSDIKARQNHVVFARRGCGKTLLLHQSGSQLPEGIKAVYLNCEDFKKHSFPNVLIEILDAVFGELERHLTGWFGRKRKSREIVQGIRMKLEHLKAREDVEDRAIRETVGDGSASGVGVNAGASAGPFSGGGAYSRGKNHHAEVEQIYHRKHEKLRELDNWLPELKRQLRDFFEISGSVKCVFIQIDDLYHLQRDDQAFVVDYVHRLCKDLPLYFKIATLRHASVLYVDRGQPIGAQERHDYQPINIDYTFSDFRRTSLQNRKIFHEFGRLAKISAAKMDQLFKGAGFDRLVMAGGGVPRDTLSLFLEVLTEVQSNGDGRIGKDDVRVLSRANFERRIEELKHDSQVGEQASLIGGIYVLREFCLEKKTNIFLISERDLQQDDRFRWLVYRLLDYRIIHSAASAITHKSRDGTYQAFAIDIGCYANFRKLQGRFNEIDLTDAGSKDQLRSSPIVDLASFSQALDTVPENAETLLTEVT